MAACGTASVDVIQRQPDEGDEMARLRGQMSCRELAEATLSGPLAQALARLGGAIDARDNDAARESHKDPEPRPQLIKLGNEESILRTDTHD